MRCGLALRVLRNSFLDRLLVPYLDEASNDEDALRIKDVLRDRKILLGEEFNLEEHVEADE